MIKFNWKELKKYSKNDVDKILAYFTNVYVLKGTMYNYLLKHKWAAAVYNSTEPKNNYILNIDDLITNDLNATKEEQYVYLDLASKRDIFTYYNTKGRVIFLYTWKVEKYYNLNTLKTNRLLNIDDNNIYLVYEGED
jgi:hypothetical protein